MRQNRFNVIITGCLLLLSTLGFCSTPDEMMSAIARESGKSYSPASNYSGAGSDKLQVVLGNFRSHGYLRNYSIYVMNSSDWNAFASAGGCSPDLVCVLTGLLTEVHSNDELAAVIAHELIHNYSEHGTKAQSAAMVAVLIGSLLSGDANSQQTGAFASMMTLGFSRSDEAEADREGLFLMTQAGYNPMAAAGLWDRISKKYGSSGPKIFMDHPPSPSRAKELRSLIRKYMAPNADGSYRIVSHPSSSAFFDMDVRYRNALGAAAISSGTYLILEASQNNYDFTQLTWKKNGMLALEWAGGGAIFGFLFPSDFIFGSRQALTPSRMRPRLIPGFGMPDRNTFSVGLRIKF